MKTKNGNRVNKQRKNRMFCQPNKARNLEYLHPYQLGWSPMPIPVAPSLRKENFGGLATTRLKKS